MKKLLSIVLITAMTLTATSASAASEINPPPNAPVYMAIDVLPPPYAPKPLTTTTVTDTTTA